MRSRELESYLLKVWLQAVARQVGQAEASTQVQDDFVAQFNQGLVWLLLDGVDEMQATVGNPLGEIERQIRAGTLLQQSRIVLSCRLNLWDGGSNALDSFDNYRTLEFSYPQQVEQFIGNWFGSLPSAETQTGQQLCAALRESGKERIRDLVKNPLRLTLLCFNWYLGEGKLPETKAGLYEQFVADFYEWKKGLFATTGEQRRRLNAVLGELAREANDKEATRFRLRQEFVCEYLGEIAKGYPEAISALIHLMHNYKHYHNFKKASKSLIKIVDYKPKSIEIIIDILMSILQSDDHPYIVTDTVNCLGEIANGASNSKAKNALLQLLNTNISDNTRYFVAKNLGKIDSNNRDAIDILEKISNNSEESYWQRCISAIALEEIMPGNPKALAILIDKIFDRQKALELRYTDSKQSFFNYSILAQPDEVKWMIDFLSIRKNIIQMSEVVLKLKVILTNKVRDTDCERWEICYQILWFCSQNLSYQNFYKVWNS